MRETRRDSGNARPTEGICVQCDIGGNEVLEFIDHGHTPLPPNRASYLATDQPRVRTDLKPISITQPEGPSFTVDGNLVEWQKWRFPVTFDPFEGLVLPQISYDDDRRPRSILPPAALTPIVVPHRDPPPPHRRENTPAAAG